MGIPADFLGILRLYYLPPVPTMFSHASEARRERDVAE